MRKRRRVIFSSDLESGSKGMGAGLPLSAPLSKASESSSDDDMDGEPMQTSDDIPLMKIFCHNAGHPSSPIQPLPRPDGSPNLASQSTQDWHFSPRSSSLPIPKTPLHHSIH
jgi:hypothetical protein